MAFRITLMLTNKPISRNDRIRTCVLLIPDQAPHQTGPHSVSDAGKSFPRCFASLHRYSLLPAMLGRYCGQGFEPYMAYHRRYARLCRRLTASTLSATAIQLFVGNKITTLVYNGSPAFTVKYGLQLPVLLCRLPRLESVSIVRGFT